MIKNLCYLRNEKIRNLFIPDYSGVAKEVWMERG